MSKFFRILFLLKITPQKVTGIRSLQMSINNLALCVPSLFDNELFYRHFSVKYPPFQHLIVGVVVISMFILPRTSQDYLKAEYWDSFFKKRGKEAFEWYGEYRELCGILHRYMKSKDTILVIGCGNSTVSSNLYDLGYKKITNIDVSGVVIKRMQQKYAKSRPGLIYLRMDALRTDFASCSFTTIFDKGTLDALFPDNTDESKSRISRLFNEIDRLLKFGGRYVCITLLQEFILNFTLEYFSEKGWLIRICRCIEVEKSRADGSCLPVFALVCTKIRKLPNIDPVLEISMDDNNVLRTDKENLVKTINSIQRAEIVCNGLSKNRLGGVDSDSEKEAIIEVARPCDSSTRYTITVIDTEEAQDIERMTFAAFVVPFGKESEWMFSNAEGRQVLRQNCRVDRVAMITMHEVHSYPDFKGIQSELTDTIIKLAPKGVTDRGEKVSFLTMSLNSNNCTRNVRARGKSKFSGEFVVEDIIENDQHFRRLVFLNRSNVIQSEVKLKKDTSASNENKDEEIDFHYVSCEYHLLLNVGVSLAVYELKNPNSEILLLGLGGGVLTNLLHRCFERVNLTAVEIDEKICEVAKEHFCLKPDHRLKIHVNDGLYYLSECEKQGSKYDVIIFDVDNKDPTIGMSCPPVTFVQLNVLNEVVRCLNDKGLFLLNLVCRSRELRMEIFERLKTVFAGIVSMKTKEDVNEVVLCWKKNAQISKRHVEKASKNFFSCSKERNLKVDEDILNIAKTMELVKV